MGWFPFAFFRPAHERRIAHARWLMDHGDYNEARLELEGLEHPDALRMMAEAREALIDLNLLEWIAQRSAGNSEESRAALSRARSFGATKERIDGFVPPAGSESFSASHRLPKRP